MTLKPETREIRFPKIAVYDLEWIPRLLQLRVFGFYDGESYRAFDSAEDFLNVFLTSEYAGYWCFAHAGGLFDIQFVLDEVARTRRYQVTARFAGSSAIIVEVSDGTHRWLFLDSYWLLRAPLREIGKMLGQEKGGIEPLPDGSNRAQVEAFFTDTPIKELRSYNESDCRILYEAITSFQDRLLSIGGELRMTMASCAMMLFRRQFLKREIETYDSVNEAARKAYSASRVEVTQKWCNEGIDWDINSSFPYAMLEPQPGRLLRHTPCLPKKGPYLALVKVTVPQSYLPPLPYRDDERRLYFPYGTWEAWFSNIDLELLLEAGGTLHHCREAYCFEPFEDLAGYASLLYEMRRSSSDSTMKTLLKGVLNGLYGKFAERADKQSLLLYPKKKPPPDAVRLAPGVYLLRETKNVAHAHVPVAAHITAIARRNLYNFAVQCREVYYFDTDGFVSDKDAWFDASDKLGALKLVRRVREGQFLAPKLYHLRTTDDKSIIKAKGFRKLEYKDFAALSEQKIIEVERFCRIKENLRKRGTFKPHEMIVSKQIRGSVRPKRCFAPDGTSRPWDVKELQCSG